MLAKNLNGDWVSSSGVSLNGETIVMEVYHAENGLIRFVDENNERMELTSDGVYLCQRLKILQISAIFLFFLPMEAKKLIP